MGSEFLRHRTMDTDGTGWNFHRALVARQSESPGFQYRSALGTVLFFFYERIAGIIFFRAYFWTNVLVFIFGRQEANHIGASGVVYGLAFFLIFIGIFRRDFLSMLISLVVILLYGGVIYGVLPTDPRVSWESHFSGALVGIYTAIGLSSQKKV